jgi:hypothetical protein
MRPYIPELSEQRMVQRAPDWPVEFGADSDYIYTCLWGVEQGFALDAFPGVAPRQIPTRALIRQFIVWWRTLEPATPEQREAHGRLPGAIRLIDTISGWLAESGTRGSH